MALLRISSAQHKLSKEFSFWYFSREERIHKLASSIQVEQNTYELFRNSYIPSTYHSSRVVGL
jgi:hypothetical protein